MSPARILIADDEPDSRKALAELLGRWGHAVQEAADGAEALRRALERQPDLVITDLVMPGMDGLWLLRAIREELGDVPVILLTGRGTIDTAVEAIREGAYDFLEKPVDPSRLRVLVNRVVEKMVTLQEVAALRHSLRQKDADGAVIGVSPAMRRIYSLVEKVAPSKTSVVITGPSGTGKEVIARTIHNLSPRRDKPFVAINCSAIPASLMESEIFGHEKGAFTGADQRRLGCFELANGGTLFLDEVGELPVELQAKFLRVLEEEKLRRLGGKTEISVDVRVICATNRDLKKQIEAGLFREDLYFRLNVFSIELPPLCERREDIPLLAQHFVERFAAEAGKRIRGITPKAMDILQSYSWPGNIRELRNTIERGVILCDGDMIDESHLPPEMEPDDSAGAVIKLSLGMPLREVEKEYILGSLRRNKGNKSRTAEILGISEKTLYNKLNRYIADAKARNGDATLA
ncbi:MAG: sigma-54 dependent transcriptional regulator [Pseudomonadota bacterium]|nr:MAG: transcriptional regulator [Pseudomonadota bacterium]